MVEFHARKVNREREVAEVSGREKMHQVHTRWGEVTRGQDVLVFL